MKPQGTFKPESIEQLYEKIMAAIKRLRKQAEKVGAEMEKLMPGTKGQGKFYVP